MRSFTSKHSSAFIGAILVVGVATVADARAQAPDARWQPWLGCWSQVSGSRIERSETSAKALVCVVPAQTGDGVEVAVMADGKLVRSELIAATGQRVPKTMESCPGWESAAWSADGHRLLTRSEVACGQAAVKSSSVFGISPEDEWIEVRGAVVGTSATVSVMRYRAAGVTLKRAASDVGGESQPFTIVPDPSFAARYARMAAGAPVTADAVLDVTRHVDAPVAEAWLNELQQGFDLNAKGLVRLADAGMPPDVIDLMVALSNPRQFAVGRRTAPGQGVSEMRAGAISVIPSTTRARRYGSVYDCGYGYLPTTYGYYGDPCYPGYYGYGAYGYGAYGYGSGYYGYGSSYGYGTYGGYYWGQRPLVIIPAGTRGEQPRGQAVKGAGYTRRGGESTASPSRPSSSGTSRGASASSGSSGSTSTGSSSAAPSGSSGGDGGRTAKPRVPPG